MIREVSMELMLVQNLYNAAVAHKKNCNESCSVSLFQMKMAAQYIWRARTMMGTNQFEIDEVEKFMEEWPII